MPEITPLVKAVPQKIGYTSVADVITGPPW